MFIAFVLSLTLVFLFHFTALNAYYAQIKISPVKSAFAYLKTAHQKGDIIFINSCDIRNWGTNFWYHNRFQNNAAFDIRLLTLSENAKSTPFSQPLSISKKNKERGYKKIEQRFKPLLEKLKSASGYQNTEDIYKVIGLNKLDKQKRIWYVGDENRSLLGKNKKIIALLESRAFSLTTYRNFSGTRLYLLQK